MIGVRINYENYRDVAESELEGDLARILLNERVETCDLRAQVVFADKRYDFRCRVDFVAFHAGRAIAIECDGKEFHQADRDRARDAFLLNNGFVDVVYRFRAADLMYRPNDVRFAIRTMELSAFGKNYPKSGDSFECVRFFEDWVPGPDETFGYRIEGGFDFLVTRRAPLRAMNAVRGPLRFGAFQHLDHQSTEPANA